MSNVNLRPIGENIIFQFLDEVTADGRFRQSSHTSLIVQNFDQNVNEARWGRVVKVGKDVCDDIKVGDDILIAPLRWSDRVKFQGQLFWSTKEDEILAVRDGE